MIYVSVNEHLFPASISGRLRDESWDDRSSKDITLKMSYELALKTFIDDIEWSIIETSTIEEVIINDEGEEEIEIKEIQSVYDNSEYSIAGDIIDHRNGYITARMGKPTAEELLALIEEAIIQ